MLFFLPYMEVVVGNQKFKCNKFNMDDYSIFCDNFVFKKEKVDIIKSEYNLMDSKELPFSFRSRYLIEPGEGVEVVLENTSISGVYRASVFTDEKNYSISYMVIENGVKCYINTKSIVGIKWRRG